MNDIFNFIATYFHFILIYIGVGLGYTFLKWTLSLIRLRRLIQFAYDLDPADLQRFRTTQAYKVFGTRSYPPKAGENVGLIVAWAIFWPINAIWTMFHDILVEAFNYIVKSVSGIYNAIAKGILPQ